MKSDARNVTRVDQFLVPELQAVDIERTARVIRKDESVVLPDRNCGKKSANLWPIRGHDAAGTGKWRAMVPIFLAWFESLSRYHRSN
jgi:hypothetical protein